MFTFKTIYKDFYKDYEMDEYISYNRGYISSIIYEGKITKGFKHDLFKSMVEERLYHLSCLVRNKTKWKILCFFVCLKYIVFQKYYIWREIWSIKKECKKIGYAKTNSLHRFIAAQKKGYKAALAEIKRGRKRNNWMAYIFPQLKGLYLDPVSKFYAIRDLREAELYLEDAFLKARLVEISKAVYERPTDNISKVFREADIQKFHACITLFAEIDSSEKIFKDILRKYFLFKKHEPTMSILNRRKGMSIRTDTTPSEIYKILSKTIIGQDDYLRKLSNTVWLHAKRIKAKEKYVDDFDRHKHNLFCVGPTGSGKTLAVSYLGKLYGYDVAVFNAPDFTGSGWKGRDITEIIEELYTLCGYNKDRTERAIIVLDEIDKMILQKRGVDEKGSSFTAENALLKLVEGMNVTLKDYNVNINTRDILFIVSGAFEDIEAVVKKRVGKNKTFGFSYKTDIIKSDVEEENFYRLITKDDLFEYGVGKQFLGRFSDIAYLRKLNTHDFEQILLNSEHSVITGLNEVLSASANIGVKIDEAGAKVLAEKAMCEQVGARGLSQLLYSTLEETIFSLEDTNEFREFCISADEKKEIRIEETRRPAYDYEPFQLECEQDESGVECLADDILSCYPKAHETSIREMRAAHLLLCCIIFYIFENTIPSDHVMDTVGKLLRCLSENIFEVLLGDELKKNKKSICNIYYDKCSLLDPEHKTADIILKAIPIYLEKQDRKVVGKDDEKDEDGETGKETPGAKESKETEKE